MNQELRALLLKEQIKTKVPYVIAICLLIFGGIDTYLNLKGLYQSSGSYGMTLELIFKQPTFFSGFQFLLAVSAALAFFQFWPEAKNKRLRILFHMPIAPEKIISVMLFTGIASLLVFWLLAAWSIAALMYSFLLPAELLSAVVQSMLVWAFLGIALYLCVAAFIVATTTHLRVVSVIIAVFCWQLMSLSDYLAHSYNLWQFFAIILALVIMLYFTVLDFKRDSNASNFYRLGQAVTILLACIATQYKLPEMLENALTQSLSSHHFYYSVSRDEYVTRTMYPESFSKVFAKPDTVYATQDGSPLTEQEYKAALPFFYGRDLAKWGTFPSEIKGVAVSPQSILNWWEMKRFKPRDWNKLSLPFYVMIESNPKGAKFSLPDDIMRLRENANAIDFYVPAQGLVDEKKSAAFMQALSEAGFEFPIKALNNNANVKRKVYDNGFVMVDKHNQIYQLKMVDGKPWCRNLGLTSENEIHAVFINEDRLRATFAYVVTNDALYAVTDNTSKLTKIRTTDFHKDKSYVEVFQDIFGWSITTTDMDKPYYNSEQVAVRVDNQEKQVNSYRYAATEEEQRAMLQSAKIASSLFLLTTSGADYRRDYPFLNIKLAEFPLYGLTTNLILCVLLFALRNKMKQPLTLYDYLLVGLFGIVAMLFILLINRRDQIKLRY